MRTGSCHLVLPWPAKGASLSELPGRTVEGLQIIEANDFAYADPVDQSLTQAQGVQRLVKHVGLSLDAALRMAITVPSSLMGVPELAGIKDRSTDDLILVSDEVEVTRLSDHLNGPRGTLDAAE